MLPEAHGAPGIGAGVTTIASLRWDWVTVHASAAANLSREHHMDSFLGAIAEGPSHWIVRPVAAFFYEHDFSESRRTSGLVGALARKR
jgi:hypothetical protein